uniref:Uncharacterized protein n=1 Tax=Oryza glumipatula TaxID=40148 RepID=A0A0E0BH60_9ORYZ
MTVTVDPAAPDSGLADPSPSALVVTTIVDYGYHDDNDDGGGGGDDNYGLGSLGGSIACDRGTGGSTAGDFAASKSVPDNNRTDGSIDYNYGDGDGVSSGAGLGSYRSIDVGLGRGIGCCGDDEADYGNHDDGDDGGGGGGGGGDNNDVGLES